MFVTARQDWTGGTLRRELTDFSDVEDAVIRAYEEGVMKVSAICKSVGISRQTLYRILRKRGVDANRRRES